MTILTHNKWYNIFEKFAKSGHTGPLCKLYFFGRPEKVWNKSSPKLVAFLFENETFSSSAFRKSFFQNVTFVGGEAAGIQN